jgi:hypothetical protein
MTTLIKKTYAPWFKIFTISIQSKRAKLLKNKIVNQLIDGAFIAAQHGETPETYKKSMR